jgi:hypothetical protein
MDNFFAVSEAAAALPAGTSSWFLLASAGFGLKKSSISTSCDAVWVSRCGSKNVIAPADWIIPLTR